jgi:hypothetical protein
MVAALFRPWRDARTWREPALVCTDWIVGTVSFTVVVVLLATSLGLAIVAPLAVPVVWLLFASAQALGRVEHSRLSVGRPAGPAHRQPAHRPPAGAVVDRRGVGPLGPLRPAPAGGGRRRRPPRARLGCGAGVRHAPCVRRRGQRADDDDPRRAHDLLVAGFGAGSTGPIAVVMDTSASGSAGNVDRVLGELRAQPGVASVTPAQASESGRAAVAMLVPATGPQDDATFDLLRRLRSEVVPLATAGTGVEVRLGGQTAGGIDFAEVIGRRLPWFIGSVLALSFVLLMGVFRSVLVPLKAVLMNLLSIGAAYGVL